MSKTEVITLKNNTAAIIKNVAGKQLMAAAKAGGFVIEREAKINVEHTFSSKSTGGAGLGGSIQVTEAKSEEKVAEVNVGPTVVYGRIHEFGGIILPVHAKMLLWISDTGERIFAKRVQIPARPYLRPAVDEHKDDIQDAVGYQIEKQIKEVAD